MTTDAETEVPEELRELYLSCLDGAEVRAAVGDYWRHDPNASPEGADALRHRAALAVAERRIILEAQPVAQQRALRDDARGVVAERAQRHT